MASKVIKKVLVELFRGRMTTVSMLHSQPLHLIRRWHQVELIDKLYALKGDIVARGVKSALGFDMPVFEKRRFQHGATSVGSLRENIPAREGQLRRKFLELYS